MHRLLALGSVLVLGLLAILLFDPDLAPAGPRDRAPETIHVDSDRGRRGGRGTSSAPFATLEQALELLPDPLESDVTIHLAPGRYERDAPLVLDRRMREGVTVRIVGSAGKAREPAEPGVVVLDFECGGYLLRVRRGHWALEHVQVGSRRPSQREGLTATGTAVLALRDVRIRTASQSGAGLHAGRGGRVELRGTIELNEDLHDAVPEGDSFAGIAADDGGVVQFMQREGASLSIGNGSLSATYYGVIRLGCEEARVTSWGHQSNCVAINDSGRIDVHGTTLHLHAVRPTNTPIGLEDDGHVLAEGAHIVIRVPEGGSGIRLQKSSALYCNDVEFVGEPRYSLVASSGSNFVGGFRSDLHDLHADTGATITIERCDGKLHGPHRASRGGRLAVPDGLVEEDR